MAISNFTEFNLPRNAYAAFDAVSMKQLIINRLKASEKFQDIDFEGSNISALVDMVAYMYHVLMFYLNQTSSESTFSQSELFENINKIVSLIGYKPHGYHTSSVTISEFNVGAQISPGSYLLPRFTSINVDGSNYVFTEDIFFEKTINNSENIDSVKNNSILYQGDVKEYPTSLALGEAFELKVIAIQDLINNTTIIDNNNIFVFVRDVYTEKWVEWKEVDTIYGQDPSARVFEKRFNENLNYELKFGNNVNGKQLNLGDQIAIYYLQSRGSSGKIGSNLLVDRSLSLYNTNRWSQIYQDINLSSQNKISSNQLLYISLNNDNASSDFKNFESTDEIKKNAPLMFMSQNRCVTVGDFESKILSKFANIIEDVKVVNNQTYTKEFLKYFYDIGLERPNQEERVLLNQILFSDSCDFNNVYCFVVQKYGGILNEEIPLTIPISQKQAIVESFLDTKLINQNVIVCDPIYNAFDIGLPFPKEVDLELVRSETFLRIYRETGYNTSKELIKSRVLGLIEEFFSISNNKLGGILNFAQLSQDILNIPGISKIETFRNNPGNTFSVSRINFITWNPLYPDSTIESTTQNYALKYFQFPFFYQISNLLNKIEVI
jgi:hypothetical protein